MLKLTYSNLEFQNFPGEDPGPHLKGKGREGEGREEREEKGNGRREGKDRDGTGTVEGRREGGEEWGWMGAGLFMEMLELHK